MTHVDIVGIDCSTNLRKLGLARGVFVDGKLIVKELSTNQSNHIQVISAWLRNSSRALIALDAPLGWPEAMGANLHHHRAGESINIEAHKMFRRYTDGFIKRELNKTPFDVGANLIARTALFALKLIESIRQETGHAIPLAWSPQFEDAIAAIEVYPAATLESRNISSSGYKKPDQIQRRREILGSLESEIQVDVDTENVIKTDDNLDAVLCLLSAADFLRGEAYQPSSGKQSTVEKESWIWVKKKN